MGNDLQESDNNRNNGLQGDMPDELQVKLNPEATEPETNVDARPVGSNELRIVQGIEDSIKNFKGPRIQVIKSRDISNARNFSEKVFRVLRMHGYKIKTLTMENIQTPAEKSNSDSVTIYAIDEATMKEFLGNSISQIESPVQYLFNNSMLSALKHPILISTVSDAFYDRVGIQKFNQDHQDVDFKEKQKKTGARYSKGSRLILASFYLVAISFLLSAVNSLLGNYLTFGSNGTDYTPIPFTILIVSISAIAVRAFSLANEDRRSLVPVTTAIVMFLVFLLVGIIMPYLGLTYSILFTNAGAAITLFPPVSLTFLAGAILLALSFLRYVLFMGANSGRSAYAFSLAGIVLFAILIFISHLPLITVTGHTVITYIPEPSLYFAGGFSFAPDAPVFGSTSYFFAIGVEQFMLFQNYILFIANVILALSYGMAIKEIRSENRISA